MGTSKLKTSFKDFIGQLSLLLLGIIFGLLLAQYNQLQANVSLIEYFSVAFALSSTLYIFTPHKKSKAFASNKGTSALHFMESKDASNGAKKEKPMKLKLSHKSEFKLPSENSKIKKVKLTLIKKDVNEDNPDQE